MNIKFSIGKPKTDAVVYFAFDGEKRFDKTIAGLPSIKKFNFSVGNVFHCYRNGKHIFVIGLGKKKEFYDDLLRRAAVSILGIAKEFKVKSFLVNPYAVDDGRFVELIVDGLLLSSFNQTFKKEKDKKTITIYINTNKSLSKTLKQSIALVESQNYARSLANMPPNIATPEKMVEEAKKLAKRYGMKIKVYDKKKLKKMGANAILAVNAGSGKGAYIVELEYNRGNKADVAFVGKGITFDSGGLGIKPGRYMLDMKMDKSGAAVVLGIMRAIAELKLPIKARGFLGLTENMPGQNAYKPGDVIKALNGKTIEILHTDAEGRVVLADVLSLASKRKPKLMLDYATLTGAMSVALGDKAIGMFPRAKKKYIEAFKKAGMETYERVWEMPMFKEYEEMIKGEMADVKNIGSWDGDAGSITAAKFLEAFVDKGIDWIHFDIASMMDSNSTNYAKKGVALAPGVRMTVKAFLSIIRE